MNNLIKSQNNGISPWVSVTENHQDVL